jgi:hypothetical protein
MPTLTEIREQYPQYSDMSDAALAGALHQKFYSDMPRAEFDAKVGFKPAAEQPAAPATNVAGKRILAPAETPTPEQPETAAPKPPPYKTRLEALDDAVNLLEEGAPKEQLVPAFERMGIKWDDIIKHGQQRGSEFFQQQPAGAPVAPTGKPAAPGEMKAFEPNILEGAVNLFKRVDTNLSDAATGFLVQTGGLNPDQASTLIARDAKRRAAAMPDTDTRAGMEQIGNAKTYGGAISAMVRNPAATFTMLAESALTSVAMSAPALVLGPAGAATRAGAQFLSSGGMEYATALTDVLQDAGVNLLDANAVADALNNKELMDKARDKAVKRGITVGAFDAATMGLAGRFLAPAQRLIAEGKLAGQAARRATLSAWGKELALQAGGGAGGEFAGQQLTGENKPTEVLMEALAEGVTAPLDVRSNLREAAQLEQAARFQPGTGVEERIEPTLDAEAFLSKEPVKTLQQDEADEVEAITQHLIEQNIPADNARRIAEKRVAQSRKERITDLIAEPSDDPVEVRAKEHIDAGMDPVDAINRARLEIQAEQEADESAAQDIEGAPSVGTTVPEAGGVSPAMAGEPSQVVAPTGAGAPEQLGVVPAGQDVAAAPAGETGKPVAVTEPQPATETKKEAPQKPERKPYEGMFGTISVADQEQMEQTRDSLTPLGPDEELPAWNELPDGRAFREYVIENQYGKSLIQEIRGKQTEDGREPPIISRGLDFNGNPYMEGEASAEDVSEVTSGKAFEEFKPKAPAGTAPAVATPVETKPAVKRGRKPVALTEEQRAQKEKTTKETNAANARVRRQIDRLANDLAESNTPVNPEDHETPEALETAQHEKRAQRINAVRTLLTLAKQQGNSALGNRAKAVLADRKLLSQQEHDLLKAGWQATQASKAARTSGALAKVNPGVKGTMTANQVLSQVTKTGDFFQRKLAGLLRKMLVGVNVHVIEKGDQLPEALRGDSGWDRARAVYIPPVTNNGKREVYLRGASFGEHNGVNNVTILHELLHAALNRKVFAGLKAGMQGMDAPLAKFVDELQDLMALASTVYGELERRNQVPAALKELVEATIEIDPQTGGATYEIFDLPHEFLSYGMTESAMQDFLKQLPSRRGNAFSRFAKAIMDYLKLGPKDASAFTDLLSVTEDLATTSAKDLPFGERIEASFARKKGQQPAQPPVPKATVIPSTEDEFGNPIRSAKALARDVQVAQEKVRASRDAEVLSATEQLFKARDEGQVLSVLKNLVANKWQNMSHAAVDKLVRLPTMTFMADWSGIKAIQDADRYMQQMVGMANSLTASAYDVRRMLAKELNPFFRSAKDFRTKFENLVYETTIARYDPSNPRNKVRNKHLDKMWVEIGDTGRRMYKGLQQHYENLIDLYSDLLDQQIENLQGLAPEAKQNLMAMLRSKFESGARIKPYFPLVRYGDYWLRVTKGDFKGFYMFESVGDRNAFRQQLADEMQEDSEDTGIFGSGDTVRTLRRSTQANSQMLKEIFDALDKEGFNADDVEALKDSIYQIYLNTMPEQSFRDMFIHRKDRTGFSTDVLRNVSASASKMSMQLARLKYAPMLRNSVSAAYDATNGNSNLSPFAKETERRVSLALSGNTEEDMGDAIAGIANKASYFWYLSSAASALIQPASVYIASLPVIGANHNDMLGAAKELGKMVTLLNQYSTLKKHPDGTTSIVAPSLANNESLAPREKEAVREMFQRGVTQSTYTSLVWGYKNLPTSGASTVLGKGAELIKKGADLMVGALMHNTERLTREATFLASYRLGYKQNLKKGMAEAQAHQAAINQAVSDVNEALANYDVTNRPRYMQRGIGRVLYQFKMFPVHTALLLTTNFFKMLPVLNKEGKAAAAKKFFGIYLTAGSIAGAFGIFAFSPIVGVLAAALKSGGDDLPDELKDKDPELWFREVFLPDLLGDKSLFGVPASELVAKGPLDAVTGLAISSRIGLNDLFGRDTKEAKTAREGMVNWMLEHAGPSASLGLSIADAYDAYQLGDYKKAVDRLSPAVLRNLILADRMAEEGIKDSKGNVVLPPDRAKAYALAQALGFRPAEVAHMGETNFKLTAIDQRIQNERNTLLGRMKVQARKQDDEGALKLEKIFNTEVARFNTKNPEYALMPDEVVNSLVKDLENRASARLGFVVNEKNARLSDPVLYRMEQRLEKLREKK